MATMWSMNWLRFLLPTVKPPAKPGPMDDPYRDFTFSNLGSISAGLTPDQLQGILTQAGDGYCDSQALLIKEIQEREPVIAAHLATRRNAILGKPWCVSSTAEPERAAEIDAMLRTAGLTEALGYLSDFLVTGYAGVVTDWGEGGARVEGFVPLAPEAFEFDFGGNAALRDKLGHPVPLANWHPAQFLTVMSHAKPGLPCRNGLGRGLVWLYLFKHSGLAGFARYIERYGVPFMVATLPANQWADRNGVVALLKTLGRDGVSVKKEGAQLELLQGANGSATDAQERFLRYCDEVFTLAILGQLATSGDASGLSKGQAQENVREDLLAADCATLQGAVQRGLVLPLCQMAYGMPDAGDIEFAIEYKPSENMDTLATRWKVLTEVAGRPMDAATVEEQFGVKFGEALPVPAVPEADTPPDAEQPAVDDRQALCAFFDRAPLRALELVVADALRQVSADPEAMAAWMGPVQEAIRESFADLAVDDLAGFRARLPGFLLSLPRVLGRMDSTGFETALSGAMLASVVNGYTAGEAGPFARGQA